jgi:hypothetical protein
MPQPRIKKKGAPVFVASVRHPLRKCKMQTFDAPDKNKTSSAFRKANRIPWRTTRVLQAVVYTMFGQGLSPWC